MLQLYCLAYRLVTFMAQRIFRDYPAVRAVYLRRGGARGDILPLVSDIDFALIGDPMPEHERADLVARYDRLARITTLLDSSLEIYDRETLLRTFRTDDYARYRFVEGRSTWKLLYGKDYLSELPELSIEELDGGFYTEIKVWWALFAWRFFQARKYNDESVTRNHICFKTVSEVLRMVLALEGGELAPDRREALARATARLTGEERRFAERIASLAARRFRRRDESILEDTKSFLLTHLDGFYGDLRSHRLAIDTGEMRQGVDCPPEERLLGGGIDARARGLAAWARDRWENVYRGAALVCSSFFNLDEHVLVVEVDPERLPTVEEITALHLRNTRCEPAAAGRLKLFLLLRNAAFQIDPSDLTKSWQSVIYPPANPELFQLVQRPEFRLGGTIETRRPAPAWTPLLKQFLTEERRLFYELLAHPSVYKLETLDFLRVFWKTAQLVIMSRSAAGGTVRYPLTLPAIRRGLASFGTPLPPSLRPLSGAYAAAVEGNEVSIAWLIPDAIAFLKEIEA